jgi:hypothetical protein
MRYISPRRLVLALAIGGATVTTVSLADGATARPARPARPERITLFTATSHGHALPVAVDAVGPIHGLGSETQSETSTPGGQINHVALHLPGGVVRLRAPERFTWEANLRACAAQAHGGGTFTITGGTGKYTHATGRGTFTDTGVLIGARDGNGTCLGQHAQPRAIYVDVTLTGTARLRP